MTVSSRFGCTVSGVYLPTEVRQCHATDRRPHSLLDPNLAGGRRSNPAANRPPGDAFRILLRQLLLSISVRRSVRDNGSCLPGVSFLRAGFDITLSFLRGNPLAAAQIGRSSCGECLRFDVIRSGTLFLSFNSLPLLLVYSQM